MYNNETNMKKSYDFVIHKYLMSSQLVGLSNKNSNYILANIESPMKQVSSGFVVLKKVSDSFQIQNI